MTDNDPTHTPRSPAPSGHPLPVFREALDRARPTLDDFARAAGVAAGTLLAYHSGTRRAPAPVRRRVAQYLRHLASELSRLADGVADISDP